jgi:hypothetical protein
MLGLVPVPKPQMARVEQPEPKPGTKRRIDIKGD